MSKVAIWHNPKCSKSRQALEIVEQNGCEKEVVKYLEVTPSKDQLKNVLKMLGISPRELMRTKEDLYKELDLKNETNDEKLIDAMVQNPKLIERPIIIKGNKAVIARPPEKALELL